MWGSSRAAYSMTSPGTRKPRVSCSTWAPGLPRCSRVSSQERGAPRGRGLREVAEHGERAGGRAAGEGAQHHRGQVLRLVGDDVGHRRRALDEVTELVEEHDLGRGSSEPSPGRAAPWPT